MSGLKKVLDKDFIKKSHAHNIWNKAKVKLTGHSKNRKGYKSK